MLDSSIIRNNVSVKLKSIPTNCYISQIR